MKDRRLAVRYARALLSVVSDSRAAAATEEFLTALGEGVRQSAALRGFLLDPAVSPQERIESLHALARSVEVPAEVSRFLTTLVEHRRAAALPSIAEAFRELREEAAGIVPAEVTTARAIEPELQTRAREALRRLTGREVRLEFRVDPDLIGGAVTRIGSTIYDGSLRTQLAQLRRELGQE